jgi:hypothetical protein
LANALPLLSGHFFLRFSRFRSETALSPRKNSGCIHLQRLAAEEVVAGTISVAAINFIAANAINTVGALKSKCNTAVVYGMVFAESSSLANQAL